MKCYHILVFKMGKWIEDCSTYSKQELAILRREAITLYGREYVRVIISR